MGKLLALPPDLCVHWWRIQCPNGPTTIGVCQKCRREKVYQTPYNGVNYGNTTLFPKPMLTRAGLMIKDDAGLDDD